MIAPLARVSPAAKLIVDVAGRATSLGHAVTKPSPDASVTVTDSGDGGCVAADAAPTDGLDDEILVGHEWGR